jgi:hypothetical protein
VEISGGNEISFIFKSCVLVVNKSNIQFKPPSTILPPTSIHVAILLSVGRVGGVSVTKIAAFRSDDSIIKHFGYNLS